jgi:hypothetical protein
VGAQVQISRHSFNSTDLLSRATATDVAPSLLLSMRDHVTDGLWWRPYIGLAGHYVHASRTDLIYLYATETASTFGGRIFTGAEMAFTRLPQFTISADAGYYHLRPPTHAALCSSAFSGDTNAFATSAKNTTPTANNA